MYYSKVSTKISGAAVTVATSPAIRITTAATLTDAIAILLQQPAISTPTAVADTDS